MIWVIAIIYALIGIVVAARWAAFIARNEEIPHPALLGVFVLEAAAFWPLGVVFYLLKYIGVAVIKISSRKDRS